MDFTEPTIAALGAIIKRPQLTLNLLSRPPFKYLQDVVKEVHQATGFGEGIFDEQSFATQPPKKKPEKLQFLNTVINFVGFVLGKDPSCQAAKVASGVDPEDTNVFLQQLAAASQLEDWDACFDIEELATSIMSLCVQEEQYAIPRDECVQFTLNGEIPTEIQESKDNVESESPPPDDDSMEQEPMSEGEHQEPELSSRSPSPSPREPSPPPREPSPPPREPSPTPPPRSHRKPLPNPRSSSNDDVTHPAQPLHASMDPDARPSNSTLPRPDVEKERPISASKPLPDKPLSSHAGRAPPKLETHVRTVSKPKTDFEKVSTTVTAPKVITDDGSDDDDDMFLQDGDITQPLDQSLGDLDDGGLVMTHTTTKAINDSNEDENEPQHGKLVQGLIDAQKQLGIESDVESKEIIMTRQTAKEREATKKEIISLKDSLQTLSKSANPFGRTMDHLHEDLDSMTKELDMWREESKIHEKELAVAQAESEKQFEEHYTKLNNLETKIMDEQAKINSMKASVLQNELNIQKFIRIRTEGASKKPTKHSGHL